jgi:hypothetical protein
VLQLRQSNIQNAEYVAENKSAADKALVIEHYRFRRTVPAGRWRSSM